MRLIPSCAVSGATIDHGEPCRGRHQAGASLLCALPIVVGYSLGRRPEASPIYLKACVMSEWNRSEHLN